MKPVPRTAFCVLCWVLFFSKTADGRSIDNKKQLGEGVFLKDDDTVVIKASTMGDVEDLQESVNRDFSVKKVSGARSDENMPSDNLMDRTGYFTSNYAMKQLNQMKCLTPMNTSGFCSTFQQCIPSFFTREGDLKAPALAELVTFSIGFCTSIKNAHLRSQRKYSVGARIICCPGIPDEEMITDLGEAPQPEHGSSLSATDLANHQEDPSLIPTFAAFSPPKKDSVKTPDTPLKRVEPTTKSSLDVNGDTVDSYTSSNIEHRSTLADFVTGGNVPPVSEETISDDEEGTSEQPTRASSPIIIISPKPAEGTNGKFTRPGSIFIDKIVVTEKMDNPGNSSALSSTTMGVFGKPVVGTVHSEHNVESQVINIRPSTSHNFQEELVVVGNDLKPQLIQTVIDFSNSKAEDQVTDQVGAATTPLPPQTSSTNEPSTPPPVKVNRTVVEPVVPDSKNELPPSFIEYTTLPFQLEPSEKEKFKDEKLLMENFYIKSHNLTTQSSSNILTDLETTVGTEKSDEEDVEDMNNYDVTEKQPSPLPPQEQFDDSLEMQVYQPEPTPGANTVSINHEASTEEEMTPVSEEIIHEDHLLDEKMSKVKNQIAQEPADDSGEISPSDLWSIDKLYMETGEEQNVVKKPLNSEEEATSTENNTTEGNNEEESTEDTVKPEVVISDDQKPFPASSAENHELGEAQHSAEQEEFEEPAVLPEIPAVSHSHSPSFETTTKPSKFSTTTTPPTSTKSIDTSIGPDSSTVAAVPSNEAFIPDAPQVSNVVLPSSNLPSGSNASLDPSKTPSSTEAPVDLKSSVSSQQNIDTSDTNKNHKLSSACKSHSYYRKFADPKYVNYPWLATIIGGSRPFSSGTLIDKQYILTASHFLSNITIEDVFDMRVHIGYRSTRNGWTEGPYAVRRVMKVIRHINFSFSKLTNDIAILMLDKPVDYSYKIHPICLPQRSNGIESERLLVRETGWVKNVGSEKYKSLTPHELQYFTFGYQNVSWSLREASSTLKSNKECQNNYEVLRKKGITIKASMLCADPLSERTCSFKGNSGAPLFYKNNAHNRIDQVGIVSWGIGCGHFPSVFTRVSRYIPWIDKVVHHI